MNSWLSSPYFTYALMLTLVGSIFSAVIPVFQPSYASHDNILLDLSEIDLEYDQGEDVTITGSIDDVASNVDEVTIRIEGPSENEQQDETLDNDDEFTYTYEIPNDAEDGIYTIEVEYDNESVFAHFMIDEEPDDVTVELDNEQYAPGDTVEIAGKVTDPQVGEEEVEITILDPTNDAVVDEQAEDTDNDDEFAHDFDIDNDEDLHGRYAVTVVYNNSDEGYAIFEVEEESGGGSSSSFVSATLSKTSYRQGDTVLVSGEIDDLQPDGEVFIEVEHEDGASIFEDDIEPNASDHEFEFEFDLDDDAETGEYTVTLYYVDLDDTEELTFTVSTSTSGGGNGTGSGSGSSGGLTARLNKVDFLAGETMTITGVVPTIREDETVNIVILSPDGLFAGSSAYPEPESDRSYSASLRLKGSLEPEEDYRAVIGYDDREVTINFDITGVSTDGGPLTVKTDKATYPTGSTVRITGEVSEDLTAGQKVIIRAENPNGDVYRYDLVTPSTDGSYSYSMVLGGDLEVEGKWVVTAYYDEEEVETSFELGQSGGETPGDKPTFNLTVNGKTYAIEYEISDGSGQVEEMVVNYAKKKLVISIDTDDAGELIIVLPREFIDAETNGTDVEYIVTSRDNAVGDDIVVDFTESQNDDDTRTLVIEYEAGTDIIEIAGTTIVPEFGALSAIVLAAAIVGTIAVTSRFSSKYSLFRH